LAGIVEGLGLVANVRHLQVHEHELALSRFVEVLRAHLFHTGLHLGDDELELAVLGDLAYPEALARALLRLGLAFLFGVVFGVVSGGILYVGRRAVLRLAFLGIRRIAGFGGRVFRRAGGLRCRGGVVLTSPAENTSDDDQRDDGADSGDDLVPCEPRLLRFFRGRQVSLLGRLAVLVWLAVLLRSAVLGRLAILVWLAVRVRLLRSVRARVSGGL